MNTNANNPVQTPGDRRPLRSRSWPIMGALARRVAAAGITPNQVSIAGMLAAIFAGVLIHLAWNDRALFWAVPAFGDVVSRLMLVLAAALIQFRLICNLIDGMVAVEGGKGTAVGELFNEIPDRISDAAIFLGAGYAVSSSPTLGWLAALLAVLTAYIRAVGKGAGVGSDFGGPMDKKARMLIMTLACVVLAVLPREWQNLFVLHGVNHQVMTLTLALIAFGSLLTCFLRLRRIAARLHGRTA